MRFENKVCVVTGGASGIGRCIAESFAKEGAAVCIIDVDETAGRDTLTRLKVYGPGKNHLFYYGDVSEESALETFVKAIKDVCGSVDYLINNACISRRGILSGCGAEDFNYILRIGVTAPYLLTKLLLPLFNPDAAIVNITSTRAFQSQRDTESYSAAKGGILSLTHALAVSLEGKVRVNSIAPGWIETAAYHTGEFAEHSEADRTQHPAGREGVPEDIANMALFLCDAHNGFITGQNFTVDGGMTRKMIYTGDEGWKLTL